MSIIDDLFKLFFGSKSQNDIKKLMPKVAEVNSWEESLSQLSDDELRAKTDDFKARIVKYLGKEPTELNLKDEADKNLLKEAQDSILAEAFAVVRETSKRTTGMRHFDVQILGGIVLHQGRIAEMKTGEGKTLVATLPVYLNAITGLGVHLITVNDYLAKRDAEWMMPIYHFLGLSVGIIDNAQPHSPERRQAYAADITYGTNNEFGFDYLRDNMVMRFEDKVQRPFFYSIVDEVDSVLIDEARTPLIISGPAEKSIEMYYKIDKIIPRLTQSETDEKGKEIEGTGDFVLDEKDKNVYLSEEGVSKVEELLGVDNLFGSKAVDIVHHVNQALKAHKLFKREVDYIVQDGQVYIVDEFTGRVLEGRRYSDGLHQAIEAKERVNIQNESQTYASVTFQNYFRMYPKLSGMTGTAETESEEFIKIYGLDVVVVPTNKPIARADESDKIYRTKKGKLHAMAKHVKKLQEEKKPVLLGTVSVDMNEECAKIFKRYSIKFEMLNAKNHSREAKIIGDAGEPGAVTIATNMAGRGTDIVLGGNPIEKGVTEVDQLLTKLKEKAFKERDPRTKEELSGKVELIEQFKEAFVRAIIKGKPDDARAISAEHGIDELDDYVGVIEKIAARAQKNKQTVIENGGLHVIGSERHESRRIDNQLRGRSGRQGDPGMSVFYISLEDDLMRLFAAERVSKLMLAMGMEEDEELQHNWLNTSIENAQRKVEGRNFDIRKHLLDYDDVMNQQRLAIYGERNNVLENESVEPRIKEIMEEVVDENLSSICPPKKSSTWDLGLIRNWLATAYLVQPEEGGLQKAAENGDYEQLFTFVLETLKEAYEAKAKETDERLFHKSEKHIFLQLIDSKWKEHLYAMDTLRQGIGLRGYAQLDALTEYKLEGYKMFKEMVRSLREELVGILFHVRIVASHKQYEEAVDEPESSFASATENKDRIGAWQGQDRAGQPAGAQQGKIRNQAIAADKVGRNDPCPCGSGKKYKHCHGKKQ